jgi:hypothetical protein
MSFTPISNEILDMNISDGTFRLYCIIQSYCYGDKEECYPSQRTLADRLGKCESYKKATKSNFNNFEQRSYDMNKLENLLLGRDSSLFYEDCVNYK